MEYIINSWLIIKRECLIATRKQAEIINPLLFFVVVVTLFPLASSPDPRVLKIIGPGVIWVAVLLATLLSLPRLFQEDYQDGSLEQFIVGAFPLSLIIFAKTIAQWILLELPILILLPVIACLLQLSWHATEILWVTLLIGTPALSFLGAIAAALTVGLRNNGLLLTIILLPLYIPILIFATIAVLQAEQGLAVVAEIAMLSAIAILILILAPLIAAFSLRAAMSF